MFTRDYLPLPDSGHDGQIDRQQAFLEFLEERTQQRVEYVLLDILPVAAAGEIAAALTACPVPAAAVRGTFPRPQPDSADCLWPELSSPIHEQLPFADP